MKNKLKITVYWIFVFIWMMVIFSFSSMNPEQSNGASKNTIERTIEKGSEVITNIGITEETMSEQEIKNVSENLNFPLRKLMHITEYFILSILLLNVLRLYNIQQKKLHITVIAICYIYACTDEIHQILSGGRTACFTDTLIDTIGTLLGNAMWGMIYKLKNKKTIDNNNK